MGQKNGFKKIMQDDYKFGRHIYLWGVLESRFCVGHYVINILGFCDDQCVACKDK